MMPEYKIIKIQAPHCPKCGEHLFQDNSVVSPWKCKCGIWKYSIVSDFLGEYEIEPDNKK